MTKHRNVIVHIAASADGFIARPDGDLEWQTRPPCPRGVLRHERPGKDIWLMGGGDLIASFLAAHAIDEFVVSVVPVFTGDGIPPIARRRRRHVTVTSHSVERFGNGPFNCTTRYTTTRDGAANQAVHRGRLQALGNGK